MTNSVSPVCIKCEARMQKKPVFLALIKEYRCDEEPGGPVPGFNAWSEAYIFFCPVCKIEIAVPDYTKASHPEDIEIVESFERR